MSKVIIKDKELYFFKEDNSYEKIIDIFDTELGKLKICKCLNLKT